MTAALTGLTPEGVLAAEREYADYAIEIDDGTRRVDEEAARAEATRRREQDLLRARGA